MPEYKADFHIHTVLSPCAGPDMSPINIVKKAKQTGLDIISITDHNSTAHCESSVMLGGEYGVKVFPGVEVTTKEEVHCVCLFDTLEDVSIFQEYINTHLDKIPHKPHKRGFQFIVDEHENIIGEIDYYLHSFLNQSIGAVCKKVHSLNGLFIPAHIDRAHCSLLSQLGFIPSRLRFDALEIKNLQYAQSHFPEIKELPAHRILYNSDAHSLEQIGKKFNEINMSDNTFQSFKFFLTK